MSAMASSGISPRRKFPAFFGAHDDAIRNGSFEVVRRYRDESTRSVYMNGDCVQIFEAPKTQAEHTADALVKRGLREYSAKEFKALAPKFFGGKIR